MQTLNLKFLKLCPNFWLGSSSRYTGLCRQAGGVKAEFTANCRIIYAAQKERAGHPPARKPGTHR